MYEGNKWETNGKQMGTRKNSFLLTSQYFTSSKYEFQS